MTPVDVLVELASIAVLMVGWVGLVMLMLEKDRKRTERRARHDEVSDDVATGRTENPAPCFAPHLTKEPPCQAAQEENHAIQPS